MIKFRGGLRWAGHVAYMGKREIYTELWWLDVDTRGHLKNLRLRWDDDIKRKL
jgi:hypothetical protein